MPSNITAYEWPLNGTTHIAYETGDNHIHEMAAGQDGRWRDDDITRVAGGPELEDAILTGYIWPDGHIHELSTGVTGMWRYTDLTQVTGSPLAEGETLAAYAWETRRSRQVVYSSGDGHIHELMLEVGGTWSHTDLTDFAGAPLADGSSLVGFAWEGGGTKQVIYTGNNGNIYELVAGPDNMWRYADLTSLTSSPLVDGTALAGYAWETGETKLIVYVGSDRHVHELMMDANGKGKWQHTDLTDLTGAPPLV